MSVTDELNSFIDNFDKARESISKDPSAQNLEIVRDMMGGFSDWMKEMVGPILQAKLQGREENPVMTYKMWCRPLVRYAEDEEFSMYSGCPINNYKWVPFYTVFGPIWEGKRYLEIRAAQLVPYEFIETVPPDSHQLKGIKFDQIKEQMKQLWARSGFNIEETGESNG